MNTTIYKILFFIFFLSVSSAFGGEKNGDIEGKYLVELNRGFDLMFSEKFSEAEKVLIGIRDEVPSYPLGYFSLATYYSYLLDYYESEEIFLPKIKENFDKTIEISENLLVKDGNEDNHWLLFYIGVAKSNNAYIKGKDGDYFSAMSNTMSGISYIEDCLERNENMNDAKLVLGSYMYYKSSVTHWLYDSRKEGIGLIKECIENSLFSKMIATSGLVWIFIDYEDYDEALFYSNLGLKQYPSSRYFLWGKAATLSKKGKFKESNKVLFKLKEQFETDSIKANYNKFNASYRIAKNYFELKKNELVLANISDALSYKLSKLNEDRLESRIEELEDLKKEVFKRIK